MTKIKTKIKLYYQSYIISLYYIIIYYDSPPSLVDALSRMTHKLVLQTSSVLVVLFEFHLVLTRETNLLLKFRFFMILNCSKNSENYRYLPLDTYNFHSVMKESFTLAPESSLGYSQCDSATVLWMYTAYCCN